MGFRVLVSRHPAIQTTELLTLAPAGLSPAEHPSLYWTHNSTCGFPAYGSHLECVTAKRSLGQGWRMIGFGPVVHQLRHPFPRHPILLAASPQRAPSKVGDMVPEHVQCTGIGWHCVVVEVAVDDVPQPFPLLGDRLVHAPPHLLFDHRELRSHAVPPGLPFDLEFSRAGLPADEGEAHEVEGLRFAEPSPLAAFRRKASKLDEPGLLGVQ